MAAGTNCTYRGTISGNFVLMGSEDRTQSSACSTAATFTFLSNDPYAAIMAAFKGSPPDITPPSIAWVSPANNATVSSTVTLTASSTDNVAVSSTAFYYGSFGATFAASTLIGSTSTPSGTLYSISWNTTALANGSTTLWALSTDTSNNTSTASTTVNVENPVTISTVSTSTTSSTATISWTTNHAANAQVSYGLTSGYGSSTATSTLTTSHSFVVTGLTASTTYHYQIQSTDSQGNTATTSDATFYIDTAPSVPTGLTAISTSPTQINLAWASSTDNVSVTGYDIYQNGTWIATSSGASYSNTGLAASTTYSYYVDAFNAAGETSATSTMTTATTQTTSILFSDDAEQGIMESDVLNGWDINYPGVSATTTIAHSENYSYVATVAGSNVSSYATFATGTDPLYFKLWVYVPSSYTLASGATTMLAGLLQRPPITNPSWVAYPISLTNSGGTFYLSASGTNGTHAFTTNAWHAIEMMYNNGAHTVSVTLDGTPDISLSGVSTEVKNSVLIGANAGSGNIYYDDITVSNAASGNPTSGLTVRHAYPGNRLAMKVQSYLWGASSTDQLVSSIDGTVFSTIVNSVTYQEPILTLTTLSAGNHTLQVQLETASGTPRSTWTETIVTSGGTPTVGIDAYNNLVQNGHKIFPITPWFQSGPQTVYWYQQGYINAAGWATEYNTTYSTSTFYTWLHGSGSLNSNVTGIEAMGSLAQRIAGNCPPSDTTCPSEAAAFGNYASTFANDPSLLAWTGFHEASVNGYSIGRMQGDMNAIHSSDNNHPFLYDDATDPYLHLEWYYPTLVADVYSSDN
jgi:chitodextrinase